MSKRQVDGDENVLIKMRTLATNFANDVLDEYTALTSKIGWEDAYNEIRRKYPRVP